MERVRRQHPPIPGPIAGANRPAFKSIQRGETTFTYTGPGFIDVPITAVNMAKARVRFNGLCYNGEGANGAGYGRVALALTSSANLRIYYCNGAGYQCHVAWEVEETDNFKSVQRGLTTVSMTTNQVKLTDVPITAVNLAKARVRFLGMCGATNIVNAYMLGGNARLLDAATIRLRTNHSNDDYARNFYVSWEAEEIK